jgi:hypothetical protein
LYSSAVIVPAEVSIRTTGFPYAGRRGGAWAGVWRRKPSKASRMDIRIGRRRSLTGIGQRCPVPERAPKRLCVMIQANGS